MGKIESWLSWMKCGPLKMEFVEHLKVEHLRNFLNFGIALILSDFYTLECDGTQRKLKRFIVDSTFHFPSTSTLLVAY